MLLKQRTNPRDVFLHKFVLYLVCQTKIYFLLLCLFFLSLFLRLCVDILCLFFFLPLGIVLKFLWVNTNVYYFFTERVKVLAGLKAGILCSGMMIVVFLEIFRAVFCALFFTMKLPNPRRYTFSSFAKDVLTASMNASTVASTVTLSIPVFFVISFTISALVIFL